MADVILENISKIYDKQVKAVAEANLHINDKEFVVLVGPSGCGKSTLLRMIAGLEEITEGTIRIGERVVNDIPPKDRNIAMVFQNYALYPHMTVFDNMAFGLKLRKYPRDEIKKRVNEAAGLLGIEAFLDRKPKALSGGQRQRVAVGRAIVRKPEVFLFDEPLSNLDAKLRVQMRLEITKLHRRLGATMIYVTHDQVEAMTMGDRIVVMKDGFIQQVDTPLNLYNKPSNLFVAGFIGSPSMNFFHGIARNGPENSFNSKDSKVLLSGFSGDALKKYHDSDIIMGIRPEHIHLVCEDAAAFAKVHAEVEVIEPMGNESYVYSRAGEQTFVMRGLVPEHVKVGRRIPFYFNLSRIHFFDPESEMIVNS